ncbi:uncharacterized protein F4822DRAFT_163202 [Hypoxylon trugodes]|uniref:uncharacterized protein n=1 Tax=Hypoxylon trugodes TaxID=326681 RepID=UPI0021978AC5|nr:uncharacterized protein F4822DRAFT_163202 [Hypoxylon trugodes]KAI1390788.1 hypothetical protein F4822DRAFT_163202 [Hypoxylon trugodes]
MPPHLGSITGAEIRAAGEGLGKGVFAIDDLPKGTIIIRESSNMKIKLDALNNSWEFCKAYHALSEKQAWQLNNLHCDSSKLADRLLLIAEYERWCLDRTPGVPEDRREFMTWVRHLVKAHAIYLTNCAITPDEHAAVFNKFCRINHSCVPNTHWFITEKRGKYILEVKANRDISFGEQIFVSYISPMEKLPERRRALDNWGFTCNCALCHAQASGDRRLADVVWHYQKSIDNGTDFRYYTPWNRPYSQGE